jgi:hypothetical protein
MNQKRKDYTPWMERHGDEYLVGYTYHADGGFPSEGPTARISLSPSTKNGPTTWINIVTDDYEGAAALNVEALPLLIKALKDILAHHRLQSAS